MHTYLIVSYCVFAVGVIVNLLVCLSLPALAGEGVPFLYTASIDYAEPVNGVLNGILPFYSLTTIYLGNWAACFVDNQTYTSFSQHGTICTPISIGYSVVLSDVYDDQIVTPTETVERGYMTAILLVCHLPAFPLYVYALWAPEIMQTIAILVNVLACAGDFTDYFYLKSKLSSQPGVQAGLGQSGWDGLLSLILLGLAIYTKGLAEQATKK